MHVFVKIRLDANLLSEGLLIQLPVLLIVSQGTVERTRVSSSAAGVFKVLLQPQENSAFRRSCGTKKLSFMGECCLLIHMEK